MTARYAAYTEVNTGQKFPFSRYNTIVIDGDENLFDLDYSSVLINVPHELPFSFVLLLFIIEKCFFFFILLQLDQ